MKFGVSTFVTDEGIHPTEFARALEERGFESLFVPEHSHIPVNEQTWPDGSRLPRVYSRSLDPFVTLSAAAAVTERLRLGTGIVLAVQRDPITLAKEVASLDHLSGGRMVLGIGSGWNRTEMRNHGTDPATRLALLRERVLAMKEIWTKDEAEFHGRYVDFGPILSWPKPKQRPHPPILLGGGGPTTFARIVEYGDGWLAPPGLSLDKLTHGVRELQRLARDRGREDVSVTAYLSPGAEAADVARLAELGVERVLFGIDTAPRDETLRTLDELTKLISS
ncbi:LLM class F420-dependent oxidoreductase [Carbonactinospora thermoautotrophica]|uniref:LLM class F420-dependent oxidoreductase n=2 Tax=Carbonactinospora thermoautotrophica TaxID=1469144 RepID=UPI00226E3BCF|nr:LLM class F420-dependent oxidoreductase [Carbonactinospora thermoautotrophica]MCX9192022.1 LLM class F420-dependent oxidoreductase [Carbonactinospora thermoautotrophica]